MVSIRRKPAADPYDIEFSASSLSGEPLGRLVMAPAYYLHTLEVAPTFPIDGPSPRQIVDALTQFAHGFALRDRDHPIPGTFAPAQILFHVAPDNGKMVTYVESRGATREDALLYRLPL